MIKLTFKGVNEVKKTLVIGMFILGLSTFTGCSTYVGEHISGVVLNTKTDKKVYTTMVMVGKSTIPQIRTSRNCYYDVEVEGNAVQIKTSGTCTLNVGDIIELKKLYDKNTDEFVGYGY